MTRGLKTQKVDIPIGKLDTKTDPKRVKPGDLVTLENARYDRAGSIKKRPGWQTQSTTNVDGDIRAMWVQDGTLWAIDNVSPKYLRNGAWSSQSTINAQKPFLLTEVTEKLLFNEVAGASFIDASAWGFLNSFHYTEENERYWLTFNDPARSRWILTTATRDGIVDSTKTYDYPSGVTNYGVSVACSTSYWIAAAPATRGTAVSTAVFYIQDKSAASVSPDTAFYTAATAFNNDHFVIYGTQAQTNVFSYFTESANSDNSVLKLLDISATAVSTSASHTFQYANTTGSPASYGVASSNSVFILSGSTGVPETRVTLTTSTTSVASGFASSISSSDKLLTAVLGLPFASNIGFFYLDDSDKRYKYISENSGTQGQFGNTRGSTLVESTVVRTQGVTDYYPAFTTPLPFSQGFTERATLEGTQRYSNAYIVSSANAAPFIQLAGQNEGFLGGGGFDPSDTNTYNLIQLQTVTSSVFAMPFYRRTASTEYTIGVLEMDLDVYQPPQETFAGITYIGGGLLAAADTRGVFELHPNDLVEGQLAISGTGAQRQYTYTQERYDAQGNIYFSNHFTAALETVATGVTTATSAYPDTTPAGSYRGGNYAVYLSQPDSTETKKVYVDDLAAVTTSFTWVEDKLATSPLLYSEDGELQNDTPPAPYDVAASNGRLWVLPYSRRSLFPSKLKQIGRGVEFSAELQVTFAEGGGQLNAIEDMDGQLVLYTDGRIFLLSGEGPDNTGDNGAFNIRELLSDFGCVNRKSLVSCPIGHIFKSRSGFRLLTRGLQIQKNQDGTYWGEAVHAFKDAEVLAAVYNDTTQEVLISLDDDNATLLRYNVEFDAWSVDVLPGNARLRTMVVYEGEVWAWDTANSRLLKETDSNWDLSDTNTYVQLKMKTGKVSFDGLEGYQRVRRVNISTQNVEDHDFTAEVFIDDVSTASQTKTWDHTDIPDNGALRLHLRRGIQKSSRVQIQLTDSAPTGDTGDAGYTIEGMTFEVGVLPGFGKHIPTSGRS